MKEQSGFAAQEEIRRKVSQFCNGTNAEAFSLLGAHICDNGRILFRTFAPNADGVSVCGDFNGWNTDQYPMEWLNEGGIWELSLPGDVVAEGDLYKFYIRKEGQGTYKADPYGVAFQRPLGTATMVYDLSGYAWKDHGWLQYRSRHFTREQAHEQPINIYEVHIGSWKRHPDGSFFSYRELAADLLPYVKQMGYTHVELMPVSEYFSEDSWGYLGAGFFAPSSRFGTPHDMMSFVDTMHEGGVGVILDWVPAHFSKDEHGLASFDGGPLYEYTDHKRAETSWGSLFFDTGRPHVQSFLISNAVFWAKHYHIDGFRVGAVTAMLYSGGDCPDPEVVAFFQKLNSRMSAMFPDVMMMAEESSACARVTGFDHGGLGFTFRWDMGWMNRTLSYLGEDPLWRNDHHEDMTESLEYAYSERFLLPLSHDEVVHGKRSLIERTRGSYESRFAALRAYLMWQMTHPGKKLLFMGCEFGQFREWDYKSSLEWFLLDYPMHAKLQRFVSCLNRLYLKHPALWQRDAFSDGFLWLDADNRDKSIYAFCRRDAGGEELIAVFSFQPVEREGYLLRVPGPGCYEAILDTDAQEFGGEGREDRALHRAEPLTDGGYAVSVRLSPMSARIYRTVRTL